MDGRRDGRTWRWRARPLASEKKENAAETPAARGATSAAPPSSVPPSIADIQSCLVRPAGRSLGATSPGTSSPPSPSSPLPPPVVRWTPGKAFSPQYNSTLSTRGSIHIGTTVGGSSSGRNRAATEAGRPRRGGGADSTAVRASGSGYWLCEITDEVNEETVHVGQCKCSVFLPGHAARFFLRTQDWIILH